MTGVFGAGVSTQLEKNNLYPNIEAIHGASAGSMTGAYFLARQTELGSSIYWENLSANFISWKNFFIGVWQRFENRFIKKVPPATERDALNISYVLDIIKNKKILNTQNIVAQPTPLYIKLFDLDNFKIEYVDARRPDILEVLITSINVFPYVHNLKNIDGVRAIDGGIIEVIGIDFLLQKYPTSTIVVVLNRPAKSKLGYHLKNLLEGKFMQWMLGDPRLFRIHAQAEKNFSRDVEKIKNSPNVLLITPPENLKFKSRTTSAKTLRQAYDAGVREGQKLAEALLRL